MSRGVSWCLAADGSVLWLVGYLHMKRVTVEGDCCTLSDNMCKSWRLGEQKRDGKNL
jgi:hypothetical protein